MNFYGFAIVIRIVAIHFSGQGLDAFCNPKINYNISSITGTIRRGVASLTLNN